MVVATKTSLRYQVKEITDAALDHEEENELVAKCKRMMNAEKISSAMSCVNESINLRRRSYKCPSQAREALRGVIANEPTAEELDKRLTAVLYEVSTDIADCAEQVLGGMDFSEAEADKMEERLELIKSLKRKYGGSVEAVLAFLRASERKNRQKLVMWDGVHRPIEKLPLRKCTACADKCVPNDKRQQRHWQRK